MDFEGDGGPVERLARVLAQTESAHGQFETEELQGRFDEEWPQWYAGYLRENGLLEPFFGAADLEQVQNRLPELLREADNRMKAERPAESWYTYYARFLLGLGK